MSGQIIQSTDVTRELLIQPTKAAVLAYLQTLSASEINSAIASAIASLVNSAPAALDTLQELSAAIGNDSDFYGSVIASLAGKQPLNSTLTNLAATAFTGAFASLTGLPTTIAGYGITDSPPWSHQLNQTFSGTITWTGTTAPSGTPTLRYQWAKVGRICFFHFRFEWTVAGAALTAAQWAFPSGMPIPESVDGIGSTEVYAMANGVAGVINLGGVSSGNITEARLHWNAGPALEGRVRFASTGVGSLQLSGCYLCQP